MNKQITMEFNDETMKGFLDEYFKQYPRRKKNPLGVENTIIPSINRWMIISNRILQNELKKQWGDYAEYVVDLYGLRDIGISKCDMNVHIIFSTRARRDLDNYNLKFLDDGLVKAGVLVDDSYFIINKITTTAEYQKGISKMIISFDNCEFDLELLKENQLKETQKKQKREETMNNKCKKTSKRKRGLNYEKSVFR